MNRTDIHLLDLPVEILLKIFKRLNNTDVLYSLIGVEGLDLLAQDEIFTNTLNFVVTDENYSIDEPMLNRFCNDILPRIQCSVKCLVLETTTMDRILRAAVYPNLTQLKIFKLDANVFSQFCTDELLFRYNFKKQITDLTLTGDGGDVGSIDQTTNVYIKLLDFFENLKFLSSIGSYVKRNPVLSFIDLPSNTFVSSNLSQLCITVDSFGDCLCLLDGRLNQLSTFIVNIANVKDNSSMEFNSNDLPNLRSFSLTYELLTNEYDNQVVPILRRMYNLQDLSLYITINKRNTLVDGIQLENDILIHLSKLQTFVFYIYTFTSANHPVTPLSNNDIQRTFSNVKFGQVGCSIHNVNESMIAYHVFSLPYLFRRIVPIGNSFTNTIFRNVTSLGVNDEIPFEHEFFFRLARCFPLLRSLIIVNRKAQSTDSAEPEDDNNGSFVVVQYLHLRSLTFGRTHIDYVEQMLNESKTRLPSLTELRIDYDQLKTVTNNFTRDGTRLNCSCVKVLHVYSLSNRDVIDDDWIKTQPKEFHDYFPSLKL